MLRVMMSLLVSSLPINISHRLFQSRYLNSSDIVASSFSFSRPGARTPQRACSQASQFPQWVPSRIYLLKLQLGLVNGHHTLYEMTQLRIHLLKLYKAAAIPAAHSQTKHSTQFETSDDPWTRDLCYETTYEMLWASNEDLQLS